jgi:hypothetical protein
MNDTAKAQHLTALIGRLREHIQTVGSSPEFEHALAAAETELHAIEARKEQPR